MKTLVGALMISASVLAGAAYADDSLSPTRAQVVADMQQARGAGLMSNGEEAYPLESSTGDITTRPEVKTVLVN